MTGLMLLGLLGSLEAYAQDTSCGIVWYPAIQLSDSTYSAVRTQVALSGDDTVYVQWETDSGAPGVKRFPFARSVTGGSSWEPVRDLDEVRIFV
ncbi:MAG: hypothetical protein HY277_08570 [Ignavibacteriales bacterium]|nr:hypothetical protein [Ignavibacteriales bacterium]